MDGGFGYGYGYKTVGHADRGERTKLRVHPHAHDGVYGSVGSFAPPAEGGSAGSPFCYPRSGGWSDQVTTLVPPPPPPGPAARSPAAGTRFPFYEVGRQELYKTGLEVREQPPQLSPQSVFDLSAAIQQRVPITPPPPSPPQARKPAEKTRQKLHLLPRTKPMCGDSAPQQDNPRRANLFGGARPREEVLRERQKTGRPQGSSLAPKGWKQVNTSHKLQPYNKLPKRSSLKTSQETKLAPEYTVVSNPFGKLA